MSITASVLTEASAVHVFDPLVLSLMVNVAALG